MAFVKTLAASAAGVLSLSSGALAFTPSPGAPLCSPTWKNLPAVKDFVRLFNALQLCRAYSGTYHRLPVNHYHFVIMPCQSSEATCGHILLLNREGMAPNALSIRACRSQPPRDLQRKVHSYRTRLLGREEPGAVGVRWCAPRLHDSPLSCNVSEQVNILTTACLAHRARASEGCTPTSTTLRCSMPDNDCMR
jgi:hypothetical protein